MLKLEMTVNHILLIDICHNLYSRVKPPVVGHVVCAPLKHMRNFSRMCFRSQTGNTQRTECYPSEVRRRRVRLLDAVRLLGVLPYMSSYQNKSSSE